MGNRRNLSNLRNPTVQDQEPDGLKRRKTPLCKPWKKERNRTKQWIKNSRTKQSNKANLAAGSEKPDGQEPGMDQELKNREQIKNSAKSDLPVLPPVSRARGGAGGVPAPVRAQRPGTREAEIVDPAARPPVCRDQPTPRDAVHRVLRRRLTSNT